MLKKTTAKAVKAAKPAKATALSAPGISDNSVKAISESLNGILADSYALYLKTKNFHWHVAGPHFREYHLMFDAQATQILATTDLIAERVRKVGGNTLRSIGDISRRQRIKDNDAANVGPAAMIEELRQDNLTLVAALREVKELVDAAKDNATSGVVDTWTDEAEERAWFLFETGRNL